MCPKSPALHNLGRSWELFMTVVMLMIKDWRTWQRRVNLRTTCPKWLDTFAHQRVWYGFSDVKLLILSQSCLKLFCQVLLCMFIKFLHTPLWLGHAGYDHNGEIKQGVSLGIIIGLYCQNGPWAAFGPCQFIIYQTVVWYCAYSRYQPQNHPCM